MIRKKDFIFDIEIKFDLNSSDKQIPIEQWLIILKSFRLFFHLKESFDIFNFRKISWEFFNRKWSEIFFKKLIKRNNESMKRNCWKKNEKSFDERSFKWFMINLKSFWRNSFLKEIKKSFSLYLTFHFSIKSVLLRVEFQLIRGIFLENISYQMN